MAIACTSDKMFGRLAAAMEQPELAKEDRFGLVAKRLEARAEVNAIVTHWTTSLSQSEVLARCEKEQVPSGPIHNVADIANDPHYRARGNLLEIEDPRAGQAITTPSVVPILSETPGEIRHLGPALGADNDAIFGDLLGLSDDALRDLREKGAI